MKCRKSTKVARARHFAKGDSRKCIQTKKIKVQRLNHLNTLRSSNRCMVNKKNADAGRYNQSLTNKRKKRDEFDRTRQKTSNSA